MSTSKTHHGPEHCINGLTGGWRVQSKTTSNMVHDYCQTAKHGGIRQPEANPWLRLDLGVTSEVRTVRLTNRRDGYGARLANHMIFVGDTGSTSTDSKCFDGRAGAETTHNEACVGAGRYVTIMLPGSVRILNLAEAEVWGFGKTPHTHTRARAQKC